MALTTQAYIPLEQIYGTSPLDIKRINDNFWYIAKKIQGFIGENDLDSAFVESLRAGSITVNTLYATYGDIAELTVDQLVTADKVQRYKDSDTSDINYISIIGQEIKLITGSTTGATEQHVNRYSEPLYWTDDTLINMDTEETAYPVTVYTYTTQTKASLSFYNDDGTYIPRFVMGAGTGTGDNDKLIVYKPMDKAVFEYYTDAGVRMAHEMDASGHHFIGNVVGFEAGTTLTGLVQLWVQTDLPTGAKANDVWVDTDDYSRYDKTAITSNTTLAESDNEFITVSGTFTLTLHAATTAGIIKKIYNIGTGVVTLAGTINGVTDMPLYPDESVELITDGTGWRH